MAQNTTHNPILPDNHSKGWAQKPTLQSHVPRQATKRPEIRIVTHSITLTPSLDTTPQYPIVHSPITPTMHDMHVFPPPTIARGNLYDARHGFLALDHNSIMKCYPHASYNSLFSAPESASFTESEAVTATKEQTHLGLFDTTSVQKADVRDDEAEGTGSHFVPAGSEDGWNVAAWAATQSTHASSHSHTYKREVSIAPTEYYESHVESEGGHHGSRANID